MHYYTAVVLDTLLLESSEVANIIGFFEFAAFLGTLLYLIVRVLRPTPGKKRESALPIKPDLSSSPESHPANRSGGTKGKKVRRLSVTTQEGVIFCALKDIVRIEAAGSYAYIYLLNGQKLIVSRTLSTLEEQLIGFSGFMRVHKSHLVQLGYVEKYQKGDGGTVTLSDGTFIPVSRRAKDELLLRLSRQSC